MLNISLILLHTANGFAGAYRYIVDILVIPYAWSPEGYAMVVIG